MADCIAPHMQVATQSHLEHEHLDVCFCNVVPGPANLNPAPASERQAGGQSTCVLNASGLSKCTWTNLNSAPASERQADGRTTCMLNARGFVQTHLDHPTWAPHVS